MSLLSLLMIAAAVPAAPETLETIPVTSAWSGHPVGFHLQTHGDCQFVAFYDAERKVTVGKRRLDSAEWQLERLPETLNWDSHNYIVMAIDEDNQIHLCGNMHVAPLVYFRTIIPLDIASFQRFPMTGDREMRVTYPKFFRGAHHEFLFCYRDGNSGNGEEIYNEYDRAAQQWRRFLDTPLTSGEGRQNAYIIGPEKGPDGRFHICWVWRVHGGCETNNNLSYAVSSDLKHWETGAGAAVPLPMTLSTADIVDPIPVNGGVINGNTRLGFDSQKRVVISYHKFDEHGNTQLYNARLENGAWKIYKTSDWNYRWEFSGGGTIVFEIHVSGISVHEKGKLKQPYSHQKYGSGVWLLDERDFTIIGALETPPSYPPEFSWPQSDFPGMAIRRAQDKGRSHEPGIQYFMQWETLPQNRDKPREAPLPDPSLLRVIKIRSGKDQ